MIYLIFLQPSNISGRAGLRQWIPSAFVSMRKSMSPSSLKGHFTGHRILCWGLFSLHTKYVTLSLLDFVISDGKST